MIAKTGRAHNVPQAFSVASRAQLVECIDESNERQVSGGQAKSIREKDR